MELPRDWQEFLSSLNASRVKFLLVGAHALAAHGVPRYTGDLDVWVEPTEANAARVLEALKAFGFGGLKGLSAAEKLGGERVSVLGLEDLRINKESAGRPKDLLDVELMAQLPSAKAPRAARHRPRPRSRRRRG